jgi:hypothetical protein
MRMAFGLPCTITSSQLVYIHTGAINYHSTVWTEQSVFLGGVSQIYHCQNPTAEELLAFNVTVCRHCTHLQIVSVMALVLPHTLLTTRPALCVNTGWTSHMQTDSSVETHMNKISWLQSRQITTVYLFYNFQFTGQDFLWKRYTIKQIC